MCSAVRRHDPRKRGASDVSSILPAKKGTTDLRAMTCEIYPKRVSIYAGFKEVASKYFQIVLRLIYFDSSSGTGQVPSAKQPSHKYVPRGGDLQRSPYSLPFISIGNHEPKYLPRSCGASLQFPAVPLISAIIQKLPCKTSQIGSIR